jgi:hypothetical protein
VTEKRRGGEERGRRGKKSRGEEEIANFSTL